jgi:hypothetical protein
MEPPSSEYDGPVTPGHDLAQDVAALTQKRRVDFVGAVRPAHDSPPAPDSPAGFRGGLGTGFQRVPLEERLGLSCFWRLLIFAE